MNEDKRVEIPEGLDMNTVPPPPPPAPPTPELPAFPDDIFECLPNLLQTACNQFKEAEEKELFLVSALGVLSGIMPNVQGLYFGRNVSPNLYCFIMGKYGTGKGAMLWARDLGAAIEAYREENAKNSFKAYHEAEQQYHKQQKLYDKGKLQTAPAAPAPPKHLKLFIPANSSKTAVMQLLMENDGRGIMFETEGDTLADMLKQDYGNFSDVLRKAFHHEPVSYYRRANNEDVKINNPCLSVVLSGTQDQLFKLIPSIDNGLFSRFCFYVLESNAPFKNPFDSDKHEWGFYFNVLADKFLSMYKKLEARSYPLQFNVLPTNKELFVQLFDKSKTELRGIADDLDGTVNRMGLICYRIAMVLTIIRQIDYLDGDEVTCSDMDFNNAVIITWQLMNYSLYVYEQLVPLKPSKVEKYSIAKQEQIKAVCECYNSGMIFTDIAQQVLGNATLAPRAFRWVRDFCKNKRA